MVGRGGFGPPKSVTADLQSAPFGRSGTYPLLELAIGIEPTTCWLQISCSAYWATLAKLWCLGAESNHRHRDFQSLALPTELPRQLAFDFYSLMHLTALSYRIWRPGRGSNPRPLAWQASALTSWATRPYCLIEFIFEYVGGPSRTRTADQSVMSRPLWPTELKAHVCLLGRGEETRTPDPMVPNHVRYQTALHPANTMLIYHIINLFVCQTFFLTF